MLLKKYTIPDEVSCVTKTLKNAGFKAFLVGGCVRNLLIGRTPKDWDVATDADPKKITELFPSTFYENDYGTVGVVNETEDPKLKIVEVTPFRIEGAYSDARRPDKVAFSDSLEEDLKRRDFTINAIALDQREDGSVSIIDPYDGQGDTLRGIVRAVGDPCERFAEDGLRLLRAVRIASELGFKIEEKTRQAILKKAHILQKISAERIRDEFIRILMSDRPDDGIEMAQKLGILKHFISELEEGIGVEQNKAHASDVWTHLMKTLRHSNSKKWPLDIRLAALFHDIAKPMTRRKNPKTGEWTFYGHDVVGSRVTRVVLDRLKFPKDTVDKVVKLVRWHMFFSDTELITLSAVRRMINNVGRENIWDLMNVRACDRIGTGRPKEAPYRLRKYKAMVEEAMKDPVSVSMLKINGGTIMKTANIPPGPKIGHILHALLEEVLEDPGLNSVDYLEKRAVELSKMPEDELKKIGEKGKEKKDELEEKDIDEIRKKYWVK